MPTPKEYRQRADECLVPDGPLAVDPKPALQSSFIVWSEKLTVMVMLLPRIGVLVSASPATSIRRSLPSRTVTTPFCDLEKSLPPRPLRRTRCRNTLLSKSATPLRDHSPPGTAAYSARNWLARR
jgi:hypothetical protein